jgi:peptidylprolyl isomerase
MTKIEKGDTVKIHYKAKLIDGEVIETSNKNEPVEFVIGDKKMIPAVEKAIIGLKTKETSIIKIESENAYGPYYTDLITKVSRRKFLPTYTPKVGQKIDYESDKGVPGAMYVKRVTKSAVYLDSNHPLAGRDLIYEITIDKIIKKTNKK